jgi:hypothetical protein
MGLFDTVLRKRPGFPLHACALLRAGIVIVPSLWAVVRTRNTQERTTP